MRLSSTVPRVDDRLSVTLTTLPGSTTLPVSAQRMESSAPALSPQPPNRLVVRLGSAQAPVAPPPEPSKVGEADDSAAKLSAAEARIQELEQQLEQLRQDVSSCTRASSFRGREAELLRERLSMKMKEVLALQVANAELVRRSMGPSPEQKASAIVIQKAMRSWLQRRRGKQAAMKDPEPQVGLQPATSAKDCWRQSLEGLEAAIASALEVATSASDAGRVSQQTRLQVLGNALRQGVLKVNQSMMQTQIQEIGKTRVKESNEPGAAAP